jgi:sortase A
MAVRRRTGDVPDTDAGSHGVHRSTELSGLPQRHPSKLRRAQAAVLSALAVAMIVAAAGLGAYPFYTDLRTRQQQRSLQAEFGENRTRVAYRARSVAVGEPLTRILIPKLGVDAIVVEGTSQKALAAGAGHYPETPLPGEAGNVGITGHRTMNGKPFADLDRLAPGDLVVLVTPFARHTYEVVPAFDGHPNPGSPHPTTGQSWRPPKTRC